MSTRNVFPALALTLSSLIWGVSWWPLRYLEISGLHPLWSTAFTLMLAGLIFTLLRPHALPEVLCTPALWVVVLAGGTSVSAFNWAITSGDVVRVVLLFNLMPLWAALLGMLLLHERLAPRSAGYMLLALCGAVIVLWPPADALRLGSLPLPRSFPDWLGLLGGFAFSLNNVMLRREAALPKEGCTLAIILGGALVSLILALALTWNHAIVVPPTAAMPWLLMVLVLSVLFLAANIGLQYGAARLTANLTGIVMLTEILFASGSAVALGVSDSSHQLMLGGILILGGGLLAALGPAPVAIRVSSYDW